MKDKMEKRLQELQEKYGKPTLAANEASQTTNLDGQTNPPTGWTDSPTAEAQYSQPEPPKPAKLRFSPYAWAKFKYFRDAGDTEVGAFGIGTADDPLAMIDVALVKQATSSVTVEFDDTAVADFFESQVAQGRKPHQFARVWLHTHPGSSATPSGVDETTFTRVFGRCDWAVMAVLARGGQLTARLRYNLGVKAEFDIPVEIDYNLPFNGSDHEAWEQEYTQCVARRQYFYTAPSKPLGSLDSPNFYGHMPGRSIWDDELSNWEHFYSRDDYDLKQSRSTSPRSRGIAMAYDDDPEDKDQLLNSDDGPDQAYWPLRQELEDRQPEEIAELLDQLEIAEEEIDDYVCYYDDEGTLSCELSPEAEEEDYELYYDSLAPAETGGFTD